MRVLGFEDRDPGMYSGQEELIQPQVRPSATCPSSSVSLTRSPLHLEDPSIGLPICRVGSHIGRAGRIAGPGPRASPPGPRTSTPAKDSPMKRRAVVWWPSALLLCLSIGITPLGVWSQVHPAIPVMEQELRDIQQVIDELEEWLRDFCTIYQRLGALGASADGQPRDTLWIALAQERGIRYAAADILTRPHPFEFSTASQADIPLEPATYDHRRISSLYELRELYDRMADEAPGVLATFRRHEERRQVLEAERAFLLESTSPLTVGPDQGSRGGRRGPDADSLVVLGMLALAREDFDAARSQFDSALQLDARHARAFFGRGMVSYLEWGNLFGNDNLRESLPDFDRAVTLDPAFADALFMRGKVRIGLGEVQAGVRDYQGACDRGFEEACRTLRELAKEKELQGYELLMAGDFQSANRLYSEAIEIDHRYPDPWFDRGLTWAELGFHRRAIEDFDAFILHHENADSYFRARKIPLPDPDPAGIAEAYFRSGYSVMMLGTTDVGGEAGHRFDLAVAQARLADPSNLALYLHHAGDAYMSIPLPVEARKRYDEACRLRDQDACAKRDRIGG